MSWKMIVLDEPTQKFLELLKSTRKRFGKCQLEVAEALDHKFFYKTLKPRDIKRELICYDLTYDELSAVLAVIRCEQESEAFRKKYCLSRKRRRRSLLRS